MYRHFFKRLFDFLISLAALLLIGWFLLLVALWLHFANKGAGAFFLQARPGKDARIFHVIKFKTMTDERDADGNLLPDEQRLTRVGKFIRSTSIDELPQLVNVLKGDMALVGPRPLLPWTQCHQLAREIQAGCVVCGSLYVTDGHQGYLLNRQECIDEKGHQFGQCGDDGVCYRESRVII